MQTVEIEKPYITTASRSMHVMLKHTLHYFWS